MHGTMQTWYSVSCGHVYLYECLYSIFLCILTCSLVMCVFHLQVFVFQMTDDSDNLDLVHTFSQQRSRILSLAWSCNDDYIAIGSSTGSIKKINISSGYCEMDITVDKESNCIIWDLVYLQSLIVSADSCGRVQLWSDAHGTLVQSFEEHAADVLALSTGPNKDVIFSTGIDQRVVCLRKLRQTGHWVKQGEVKVHSHDVRAMDLSSEEEGLLATGGIDTDLVIVRTDQFSKDQSAKYSALQDSDQYISVASDAKIIMHQTNSSVKLWKISQNAGELPVNFLDINSSGTNHILASAISSDGTKIALSTVTKFWLYDLNNSLIKYKCIQSLPLPSYKMVFNRNNSFMVLATIGQGIQVLCINTGCFEEVFSAESLTSYLPITNMSSNEEGSFVVISGFNGDSILCDMKSRTVVYKLPLVDLQSFSSFCPSGDKLMMYSTGRICMYDIARDTVTEFGLVDAQGKLSDPKGLCLIDVNTIALYDKEAILLFQLKNSKKFHPYGSVFKFNGVLLSVFVCSDKDIVVVEQLRNKLLEFLPPVLYKDSYGT